MLRRTSFLENKASLKLLGRLKCSNFTLSRNTFGRKQCIVSGRRYKATAASVKVSILVHTFFFTIKEFLFVILVICLFSFIASLKAC